MVIQEAFEVSDEITAGLASGIFTRTGGVVRWAVGENKGAIVKHLDPISTSYSQSNALQQAVNSNTITQQNQNQSFFQQHKTGIYVGGGIAAIIAAIGGGIYFFRRRRGKKFQKAFRDYLEAMETGTMTEDIIDELDASLKGAKKVLVDATDMMKFARMIRSYTIELARNNGISTKDLVRSGDNIVDIRMYLQKQREVFNAA